MIDRYRNELIIAVAILLLIISIIYKHQAISRFESATAEARASIRDIDEAKRLKSLWYAKGMKSKLNRLKQSVNRGKIVKFVIDRKKVDIKLRDLQSRELNIFMNEMAKLPVRISALEIKKSSNGYGLECICKW